MSFVPKHFWGAILEPGGDVVKWTPETTGDVLIVKEALFPGSSPQHDYVITVTVPDQSVNDVPIAVLGPEHIRNTVNAIFPESVTFQLSNYGNIGYVALYGNVSSWVKEN